MQGFVKVRYRRTRPMGHAVSTHA
jgi:hypothetical protein